MPPVFHATSSGRPAPTSSAKNVEVVALRHAHEGDWAGAIAAFDSDRQVNGLGVDTRGDRIEGLSALLADGGIEPVA